MPSEPSTDLKIVERLQVLDPKGVPSNLIIRHGDPFQLAIEFDITSPTVRAVLCALEFEIKYSAESLGPEKEVDLGIVKGNTVAGQYKYDATTPAGATTVLDVPSGKLSADTIYKLGAVLTFNVRCPDKGTPVTRFPLFAFTDSTNVLVTST